MLVLDLHENLSNLRSGFRRNEVEVRKLVDLLLLSCSKRVFRAVSAVYVIESGVLVVFSVNRELKLVVENVDTSESSVQVLNYS